MPILVPSAPPCVAFLVSEELAHLALDAARAAAVLIRERAAAGVSVAATKSSDVDIVTEADRASEQLIRERVRTVRPEDGFLGEEGAAEAGTSGVRWVIDPIDGTVNFFYGLGQHAVSIAAQIDGVTVAGVVLDVTQGTEYVAFRTDTAVVATRNDQPVEVRGPADLALRLIATGFSYDREVRVIQAQAVTRLLPRIRDIRRLGSCALDLCLVASGALDGYVEEGVNLWDYAAAVLVAEGAGARWEVHSGAGGLDLLVCAPGHGFDEFQRAVVDCGFAAPAGE